MNAVVSLLWDRSGDALSNLFDDPATILTFPGYAGTNEPLQSRLRDAKIPVVLLSDLLTPGISAGLRAQAVTRARRIAEDLADADFGAAYPGFSHDAGRVRTALQDDLANRIYLALSTVESLELAARRYRVELILVNADLLKRERAALAWGHSSGVKGLFVTHGAGLARARPQARGFAADVLAGAGTRINQYFENLGVAPEQFVDTGWPTYDELARLAADRDAVAAVTRAQLGIAPDARIVLYATTWADKYATTADPANYENSLREAFAGYSALLIRFPTTHLIVKERPQNHELRPTLDRLAQEAGLPAGSWSCVYGDLYKVLLTADVVVSSDSSMSAEAATIGTPAINLWTPTSWRVGPMFFGDDGVIEAPPGRLAAALVEVFDAPEAARRRIVEGRLKREGPLLDGRSSERLAALVARMRAESRAQVRTASLLTAPRTDAGDRRTSELLSLRAPAAVLDLRCGDGRRARALRARFPGVRIIGFDPDPEFVRQAAAHLDRVNVAAADDLAEIDLGVRDVDVVLAFDTLQRVPDPARLLRSLQNVMRPGAQLFIAVPSTRALWAIAALAKGQSLAGPGGAYAYDARHQFTRETLEALLRETGFIAEHISGSLNPYSEIPPPPYPPSVAFEYRQLGFKDLRPEDLEEMRLLELFAIARS